MDTSLILNYLTDLSQHNDREWYHAHKAEYKEANIQFEALVQELILRIRNFDNHILHMEAKDLTFKLVRDTRFSHDKSPYNPAFRAHIGPKGKLPVPVGYYLMIKPGNQSFLGGGLFADMFKNATSMIRDSIAEKGAEWEEYKNWYLEYPICDDIFRDEKAFLAEASRIFQLMKPFNDFLNQALKDFQMPSR